MRNKLLVVVALAAVVGFGGVAAAQSGGDPNKVPAGSTSDKIRQKSDISDDQHSQIKTAVARGSATRVDRRELNFNVDIGSKVPRSVHFATLPDEIARIVPQYRGFNYFIISYRTKDPGGGDYFFVKDELVILDPQTLEIVAIIPV